MNEWKAGRKTAAIVCTHVAKRGLPILYAERSTPDDASDSGWQFLCLSGPDEDEATAEVWSVGHVLETEPSLGRLVDSPPGTTLFRETPSEEWRIRTLAHRPSPDAP